MTRCGTCGRSFVPKRGSRGKYCSRTCSYVRKENRGKCGRPGQPKVECVCRQCGERFLEFASRASLGRGKYCSRHCSIAAKRKQKKPRKCDHCKKSVLVLPYRLKRRSFLCSKACRAAFNRRGDFVRCTHCASSIWVSKSRQEIRKIHFCDRECFKAGYHGLKHHHWQHGLDRHERRRGQEFTHHQRRIILERDGYRCTACGKRRPKLHVDHHIPIFEDGKATIENGRTLCVPCHKKKTAAENRRRMRRVA